VALNLGGVIRLTYAVKNDLGALVNPGSATLTIIQPDGTTASPTVDITPDVTGQLIVDFAPAQSGLHSVHWATTNPITSEDDVFVAERAGSMLISVDEAVARLRASGVITSDADREQLQWLCMVASDAVERDLGRLIMRRTVTETYDGVAEQIVLRQHPVISVTTVVESGTTLTGTDWVLNTSRGSLYRGTTTNELWWESGRQNVTVTYVAGYADPPRSVREVALGTVQELWQASQQAEHPLLDETTGLAVQSAASALPGPLRGAYRRLRASSGVA
jgi:hypothetical protein